MSDFNVPVEKFMTLAANILQGVFPVKNKAMAKKQFKKLAAGEKLSVGKLGPQDRDDRVDLYLSLNAQAFRGTLTFHLFSRVLESLLQGLAKQLQSDKDIRTFTNAQTGDVIFFVPGFVEDDGRLNMLVTSLRKTTGKGTLELMFLDPEQFRKVEESGSSVKSGETVASVSDETADQ